MAERVLVIDPGERVGYCVAVIGRVEDEVEEHFIRIESHGISGLKDFALKLGEVFGDYDTVVYETYRIAADKAKKHIGSDVPTLQLIGVIRYLGWLHPDVKLVDQGPVLKRTGEKYARAHLPHVAELLDRLPKTHDDAHDGDAVLHAVAYLFQSRIK